MITQPMRTVKTSRGASTLRGWATFRRSTQLSPIGASCLTGAVMPSVEAPPARTELGEEVCVDLPSIDSTVLAGLLRSRSRPSGRLARTRRSRRIRQGGCRACEHPHRCSRPGTPRGMPCRSSRVQGPAIMYATRKCFFELSFVRSAPRKVATVIRCRCRCRRRVHNLAGARYIHHACAIRVGERRADCGVFAPGYSAGRTATQVWPGPLLKFGDLTEDADVRVDMLEMLPSRCDCRSGV